MRVIKSGVEMTPEQLTRVKGGACACGCNFSTMGLHSTSESGGNCACNCKFPGPYTWDGAATTAATYL